MLRMQELTMLLIVAGLISAAAGMLYRKAPTRFNMLVLLLNMCAVGAVLNDPDVMSATDSTLTLTIMAPLVLTLYSIVELISRRY